MRKLGLIALSTLFAGTAIAPMPAIAVAQAATNSSGHVYYRGHYHHRHRCGGGNGVVGTVGGGVGGALIGKAVIGGPVGIVAGAVGGGLLGRHLDKVHTRHRRGC